MTLEQTLQHITPADSAAYAAAQAHQQAQAKPLGGLGLLEDALARLAGGQHTENIDLSKRAVVVFCADNGVVAQGVTQCGQEVTAVVARSLDSGCSSVSIMAQQAGVDVIPVDIGVAADIEGTRLLQRKLMHGTDDITKGPAMSRETCIRAIETGISIAEDCAKQGYKLLAMGEMGIGNTTTSAAVTAVLLNQPPSAVTGRGAGLSQEGLHRKIRAIETALQVNHPKASDPVGVLSLVGGLDLAGLAGLVLGGACYHLPVVLDGVISAAAALTAVRLCPDCAGYLIASHVSAEPASRLILETLELHPFICANMHLGEGTGAVAGIALLDQAAAVYRQLPRFGKLSLTPYVPLT